MNTENHYQETDLGNISLNPRGEYNPEESYEYLDLVVLEGGSYVCLAENGATITGISPESGKTTQYWQVITIPGSLTPEYIAMHDRVVNLSEQVGADAVEVRTAEQNVSGMELNVTQMQEQTRQSAEAAEQSKDSSAGYAASADASRQAAEESKQNIDAQVTGFDSHVAEKTEEAENDIEAARIAANKAIIAQQEQSVNEVARAGIEAISTAQAAAQTATEKAQAADTSEKNAAASETAAKLSETNATKMAEQVAADKEQVANDRTAVENAKQEMTESVAQIEQNTQGISELKGDLSNKITKFYASNQGEIYITDSDNGKIQDMMIYGKSSQDGAPTPENPYEIKSVVNPTVKVRGKNFYSGSDLIGLTKAYTTDFIPIILRNGKICISFDAFSDTSNGNYLINVLYFDANKEQIGNNGSANEIGNNISHVSLEFDGTKAGNNYEDLNLQNVSYVKIIFNIYDATSTEITYKNIMISATDSDFEPYKPIQTVTIPYTLNAIPVNSGDNVTIDGQQYVADYVDVERGKLVRMVDSSKLDNTQSIVNKTEWLLAEPQEIDLTQEETQTLKTLATYYPTTNISVNSEQLDGYTVFNYPISMQNGWNYVKQQLNDNRDYIYDMDLQSAEAYVNSEYAVALTELEV